MNDRASAEPLVSIVLPTYKRAHVLPSAISSVLNQTYANLELIVVDDNSPDGTRDVVASFSDPRIRYVRNDPNLKLPRALNRGFSLSRGEYLTWTSDDNLYANNAIAKMLAFLQATACDFVFADYFDFADLDPETQQPLNVRHVKLPDTMAIEKSNRIGACFLYTREVYEEIGLYDPELFLVEDYDYFIRVGKRFRMCHLPEPLYFFRRDEHSLYVSRFCEVKAADVLVRYKNGFLTRDESLNVVVELIVKNIARLRNPLLRSGFHTVSKRSYTLTVLYRKLVTAYIEIRARRKVMTILEGYSSSAKSFNEAKSALTDLMNRIAVIQYA
jgi:glycosyltransferase involved in cell wall biosynthesis